MSKNKIPLWNLKGDLNPKNPDLYMLKNGSMTSCPKFSYNENINFMASVGVDVSLVARVDRVKGILSSHDYLLVADIYISNDRIQKSRFHSLTPFYDNKLFSEMMIKERRKHE